MPVNTSKRLYTQVASECINEVFYMNYFKHVTVSYQSKVNSKFAFSICFRDNKKDNLCDYLVILFVPSCYFMSRNANSLFLFAKEVNVTRPFCTALPACIAKYSCGLIRSPAIVTLVSKCACSDN